MRFMNDDYYKQQAARVRSIASLADPFTKKRLLALAEQYDGAKPSPRRSMQMKQSADHEAGSDSRSTRLQSASVMSSILISQEILSDGTMSGNSAISPGRTNPAQKT
jgi:hypothetical protein